MTTKTKAITISFAAATALIFSAQSLYACSSCGCTPKKEAQKACCAAADKAGTTCPTCADKTKATPACTDGVCSLSTAPQAEADHSHGLSTFELKGILDSGNVILLDARSGKYDDGYRIPGAKSLTSESTAEEIAKVIPSKNSEIVTYCGSIKCPASKKLADHLAALGYTHVHEYPEGIAGWRAAGGQVEKAN